MLVDPDAGHACQSSCGGDGSPMHKGRSPGVRLLVSAAADAALWVPSSWVHACACSCQRMRVPSRG